MCRHAPLVPGCTEDLGPSVAKVLNDPACSYWLRTALDTALRRDPVDAANDAELLARLLDERCRVLLGEGT